MKLIGREVLNFNKLNTLLAEATTPINNWPLGIKLNEHVNGSYLSPNSLQLGTSSKKISSGAFQPDGEQVEDPRKFKNRFLFVQAITEQF